MVLLEGGWWQSSMKTAPTLCAFGAGLGLGPVGLAVIREDVPLQHHHLAASSASDELDMTAIASPYPTYHHSIPHALPTPLSTRSVSEGQNGKARSGRAVIGQKRTLTPSASFSVGFESTAEQDGGGASRLGTPNSAPSSWFRRLSSNMSNSRDSSRTPTSRPGSAAVSHSNGSIAYSHAGSASPIFPDDTPSSLPPNKLVKRSSSLRSANGVPFSASSTPGSRLPLPVLKRPATSHQRSANSRQESSGADSADRMSIDGGASAMKESPLRHYFTPKSSSVHGSSSRKRNFSGIPTPTNIRRIYPDRKYKPILVSSKAAIAPAPLEKDDGAGLEDDEPEITNAAAPRTFASSPLPAHTSAFQEGPIPRRSFSIGDLLSSGPQPLWRRPSQKAKDAGSRLIRRRGSRVVSAPQQSMGNTLSSSGSADERPAKRRDLTNPQLTPRSIYSSSSSNPLVDPGLTQEAQLNVASTATTSHGNQSPSAAVQLSHPWSTPPLESPRLPSASSFSIPAKPVRVSAVPSEVVSLVDSDSEYRSIGDASTDYQSDTVFNSYNTRTTRSSSGKRGPHIGKIFDDSPPDFSSGRSTKLHDLLRDGSLLGTESGRQHRHSTIEEEGSITSTPVRSLRTNSVMSTPSARAGAPQIFASSPPLTRVMPDPDDIDWDASDDGSFQASDDEGSAAAAHQPALGILPYRFGSTLRDSHVVSADSTPTRLAAMNNPFDWSEVQPSPNHSASPPRPRTVHGKKNIESRGSRAAGRRAPSGMHARSHSVPVAPDTSGRRMNVVANKFGTWNVGSKIVTEDWNDDFAFDDASEMPTDADQAEEHGERSGRDMIVPRSIREQQENVVANISLLREWGLLIEELKELRIRASTLGMLDGSYAHEWEEVDAMIELADQETEEQTLEPRRTPPSSPGFDTSAFEEQLAPSQSRIPAMQLSDTTMQEAPSSSTATLVQQDVTRPRKDSEAVAQSIIQALHSRRSASDPATVTQAQRTKKVPFDTATLRHIVPYVNGLKRRVKEALRETENLRTSPHRPNASDTRSDDLWGGVVPFSSPAAFNTAHDYGTVVRRKSRREEANTDHDGLQSSSPDQSADLASRVQRMNLPR